MTTLGPAALVVLLLVMATAFQGAFSLRAWAPPALFVLGTLAAMQVGGGVLRSPNVGIRLMLAGIWGFAIWTALSMLWANSPGDAWAGAGRTFFYAALVSVPPLMLPGQRSLRAAAIGVVGGVAVLATITLVRLLTDGEAVMLAGRLNEPVGYRNATACLFGIAVWPLIVVAASRGLARGTRATAFGLSALCLGLAFLTQSRGIVLGLAVGGLVALSLGPDRVRRTWLAILAVGGVAAASHWLLRPYEAFDAGRGVVTPHDISTAAVALVVLTVAAFFLGLFLAVFDSGLRPDSPSSHRLRHGARIALIVLAVAAVVGGAAKLGDPVAFVNRKWDEFRSNQTTATTTTRLGDASGQRYDLWRVALDEFTAHPVAGVGEGSYSVDYYRLRATDRNLNNPHSLFLRVLAELGIVGAVLLVLILGGAVAAVAAAWRRTPREIRRPAVGLMAGGAVVVAQLSVDWIWQIPGVIGLGLLTLSLGVTQIARGPDATQDEPAELRKRVWRLTGAAALAIPIAGILALYGSTFFIQRARAAAGRSPTAQLSAARTAARFDPLSVTPEYLQASALESMGRRDDARARLRHALSLEPRNLATMGLLGDLEARAGRFGVARAWYRRALALNPKDVGLQKLAALKAAK